MSFLLKPLAYLTAASFSLLGVMSHRSQKARYYFHLTLYLGALGFCSFLGVVYGIFGTLVGQRFNINYLVARSFYHICSPLIGIKLEVEGMEHLTNLLTARDGKPQSAVLIGNHQSMMDILYLGRIFPKRASIMAKKELKYMPLLGQFMSLSGAVFIDRKNSKDAVKMMNQVGDEMKRKGVSLWIFPEGTRSSTAEPHLLPFKKGAFHLAVQASVPIVPVVCETYYRLFNGKNRMERGVLRVRVLPPISTENMTPSDVSSLSESIRLQMLSALQEISSPGTTSARPSIERTDSADSTAPLNPSATEYGTTGPNVMERSTSGDSELRRRVSQGGEEREMLETGQLEEGKEAVGKSQVVAGRGEGTGTEDEEDEGAVLVKRP